MRVLISESTIDVNSKTKLERCQLSLNDEIISPLSQIMLIAFQVVSSRGGAPCHLTLDSNRKLLFAANYVNSLTAFQLNDEGKISHEIYSEAFGSGSNVKPDRQGDAHPHAVVLWNDFLFVVDLGADKIWRYRITTKDDGQHGLEKVGETKTPLGWGPRHMAIKNNTAYVIFELETKIGVYQIDAFTGELIFVSALPTVADKSNWNFTFKNVF